jgi:hypothetical protein
LIYMCIKDLFTGIPCRRYLSAFGLLPALVVGSPAAYAAVAVVPASHHHGDGALIQTFGNGKFNKNTFLVNSTISDRAVQGIRNANAGGNTVNVQGLCKWKLRCKLIQRTTVDPW